MFAYDPTYRVQFDNKFVDTDRFAPVANGIDLPDSKDPFHIPINEYYEEREDDCVIDHMWWMEQRRRCLYGYTVENAREDGSSVTITGRHYFYLNFWPIYGLKKGGRIKKLVKPRFTDLDYQTFWEWQTGFALQRDILNYKSRQKGFSEKTAGGYISYNYLFFPDSVNIIVAGTEADASHTMANCRRGLNDLKNTQFYKHESISRQSFIKSKYFGSEIRSITAKDNPQALSRFSPFAILYEEVGKWKKGLVKAMKGFVQPSIVAEGKKTGTQMFTGTAGDMEAGAADLEHLYYNPIEENLLDFPNINEPEELQNKEQRVGGFVPRYLFTIVDDEGNSLYEESEKHHEEQIKKQTTETSRYLYRVNNPKYGSEGFDLPAGGYFDKRVIQALNKRKRVIKSNRELQIGQDGHWDWNNKDNWNEGSRFMSGPNEDGDITSHVTETYREGSTYSASIDSYDRDEAGASDSKGAMNIYKHFNAHEALSDTWVARIYFRPDIIAGGAKRFFEETIKMGIAYNCLEAVLIEYSNLRIFDYYEARGVEGLLQERPEMVVSNWIKKSVEENRYGIDPSSKPHWIAGLNDYLLGENGNCQPVNRMYDLFMIDKLSKFKYNGKDKYNCDTTITAALNIVQRMQLLKHLEKGNQEEEKENARNFTLANAYGF